MADTLTADTRVGKRDCKAMERQRAKMLTRGRCKLVIKEKCD
jgi:pyruvate/2-oxoglutarate dehydrogenase complex dihydrolipoamide dehydrogenase (E3) component